MEELEESMPLLWSPPTLDVELPKFTALGGSTPLPPEVGGLWMSVRLSTEQTKAALSSCLRSKQEMKLQKDWMIVKSALPHATYKDYAYNWLIINTRSLYYDLPTLLKPLTREDHMCLCPFVDYFNHADEEGCHVAFEEQSGFTVTSLRDYECGEELFVSYGPHPNDFLLVEYGFILETNKWDSLQIDALILSAIDDKAKERLRDAGYLGEHSLSREGVCHRTQVAVRTQTLNRRDWGHYVQGRATSIEEVDDEKKADAWICRQILMTYHNDAIHALKLFRDSCVRRPAGVTDPIRSVLQTRWMQIETMIRNAFNNSINPETRADFSRLWTADEV
ncbi:hypothetical protein MMC30_005837 [Trapelia coarctata]|nr:hypothetical protein [Trapelia coarctata]